ncbi:EGFR-like transmembrane domain-containing protein [Mangrovihabitans endophyticus]|uniref:LPXTG-motif cell wall anchor domain-containing protein n=1 Tax=Mangrovihabitans endophyticus TaxID=1751298 RepID=A0A8J3FQ12_9ACTN|nr:transmembrane domain-containing protein [Mangrovihabitans endophyticus]GGK97035.1 hypothetical protein GCM10012284_34130 [Mangrovihabitans endophyticus]
MMLRTVARMGAAGLFAAGSLAVTAGPALAAADVDFGVSLKGTTIAANSSGKFGAVDIANNGTTTPDEVEVMFDATKLDTTKVKVDLGACTFQNGIADCVLDGSRIPGPGETSDLDLPLIRQKGASGSAGKLTVTVKVKGDTNKSNDSRTVDVKVGDSGVDMVIEVPDVTGVQDNGTPTGKAIPPGGSSLVEGFVENRGDRTADGVRLTVSLPKGATFSETVEGCKLNGAKSEMQCTLSDFQMVPVDRDAEPDEFYSAFGFAFPVVVGKDVTGPVSLKGGNATVAAVGVVADTARKSLVKPAAPEMPDGFSALTSAQIARVEVDATDNSDDFAVLVAGPAGGQGGAGGHGGNGGNGNGGGQGGGDGGGLPVTGPVAATVGGVGAAVVLAGVMLFVLTRRRRIVLQTPRDGR